MFVKNVLFLRISSIIYLFFCLLLAGMMFFVVFGEMGKWENNGSENYVNFFKTLGGWWYLLPIISIVNAIFSPIFASSIYLHFKYTNNRKFLKYTWLCLFNTVVGDFILIRPIFLILFIIKIWNHNLSVNINHDYKHLNTRAMSITVIIMTIIIYFSLASIFKNTEALGWGSFFMIIYGIIPKLVMNSFIDIKFSNLKLSNRWIIIYLTSSFFGIFPYCYYLSKNYMH